MASTVSPSDSTRPVALRSKSGDQEGQHDGDLPRQSHADRLESFNDVDVDYDKDREAQIDHASRASLITNSFTRRLLKLGVEELGVHPIPEKERTDTGFYQVFTLWVAMSVGVIP